MLGCRHPVTTTLVTRSALAHASERHRKTTHGTSALARERRRKVASVLAYHRHDTSALARERYPIIIIGRYPKTPLRWQVINHIGRCPPTVKPSACARLIQRMLVSTGYPRATVMGWNRKTWMATVVHYRPYSRRESQANNCYNLGIRQ